MNQRLMTAVLFAFCLLCAPRIMAADARPPATRPSHNLRQVVFVCDGSDSMAGKIATLRRELVNTIDGLRPTQSFNIIFMRDKSCAKVSDELLLATPANKQRGEKFINDFKPGGKTDPMPALKAAFRLQPTIIYLLCDHDWPDMSHLPVQIAEMNREHKVKVDTIAFMGEADKDTEFMKILDRIAKDNGGVYKFVKESDL
jgi:hypothetical protein